MDAETALKQLDRTLSFFPRVDGKASAVFALNAALIGLECLNTKFSDLSRWYVAAPAAIAATLLTASLWLAYRANFPDLKGGGASLLYFREIAKRPESEFLRAVHAQSEEDRVRDALAQVWRNSEILSYKFDHVHRRFGITAWSLLPWCLCLLSESLIHGTVPVIKG